MPVKCPACDSVNPDTQKYCGECGASLPASRGLIVDKTETIQTASFGGLLPGGLFAGKYRIAREIGRGGMGVVFEAEDVKLKRSVALKFLPRELLHSAPARERFVHEAQAASALDHPNICTVYEIGEAESGQMYIAMAYYRGESLKDKIRRGTLNAPTVLSLAAQVADGLAKAHEHGIIHRDIKPANILITEDGTAKIVDFGLAKLTGDVRLTKTGTVTGTVAYMSPEQVSGENVDIRTDVWSLGVVIYEMLTGGLPFEGASEQSFGYAIVNKNPRPLKNLPREMPRGLIEIVETALAKNPAKRFASGKEMADALNALRAGAEIRPRRRPRIFLRPSVAVPVSAVAFVFLLLLFIPRLRLKVGGPAGFNPSAGNLHLAILPLNKIGGSESDQALSDGLTALLGRQMGQLAHRLKASWVSPLSQVRSYGVKEAGDADKILGSNIVFAGTLKRTGDLLSITVDAVDPRKLRKFTTLSKTDSLANLATWQEDLAVDAAQILGISASPEDRSALEAAGTTVPGAFESYLRGLGFYSGEGEADAIRAVEALREAVQRDPSFATGEVDLAAALWWEYSFTGDRSQASEAEARCRQALRLDSRLDRAHLVLGRICRGLGRFDDAVREFRAVETGGPLGYDADTEIAHTYEQDRQPAKAEASYRDALRLRPGYWEPYSYLGYFYFFQGQTEKARDMFLAATRIAPNNIEALNCLGGAYFKLGDYDQAEAALERSNAIKRNSEACSNLGTVYYFKGRYADASRMYEAAISYEKDSHVLWGNLGDAYSFTPGNETKAADAYAKAIELAEKDLAVEQGNAEIRSRIAVYLAKTGSSEKAEAEMSQALRQKPDDPTIVLKSILVFELSGNRPRALEALKSYLELKGPVEEVLKEPFLASLRRDPGYLKMMGREGARPGR